MKKIGYSEIKDVIKLKDLLFHMRCSPEFKVEWQLMINFRYLLQIQNI